MAAQRSASRTLGWLLAAMAAISLVVGGISIMNITLVSVTERTGEIGLRQALGATPNDIAGLFLLEALVICTIGGALGVLLGAAASELIGRLAGWSVLVTPAMVLGALASAARIGMAFGYLPARSGLAPGAGRRSPPLRLAPDRVPGRTRSRGAMS